MLRLRIQYRLQLHVRCAAQLAIELTIAVTSAAASGQAEQTPQGAEQLQSHQIRLQAWQPVDIEAHHVEHISRQMVHVLETGTNVKHLPKAYAWRNTYELIPEDGHNHVAQLGQLVAVVVEVRQRRIGLKAIFLIDGYAHGGLQQHKGLVLLGIRIEALEVLAPIVAGAIEMWHGESRRCIICQ